MSNTFYIAAGGLLVLLAALMGFLALEVALANPGAAWGLGGVFGGLGFLLLLVGMRSPFPAAQRTFVKRKFTPSNVVLGAAMIAGGIGVLYLFYNVIHVMPRIVLIGALLAIPIGVFVMASIFGDACVRCDRILESQTLRFAAVGDDALGRLNAGDAEGALALLGAPVPDGRKFLQIGYCPGCLAIAVCRVRGKPVLLREFQARLLAECAQASAKVAKPLS